MKQHIGTINKIVYAAIIVMIALIVGNHFLNDDASEQAQIYFDYGVELEANFQSAAAEMHFTAAIELRPRFAEAYGWRCDVRYGLGKFEEALEDCNRALELDESLGWVYGDRCIVYAELGDFELAEADCDRAVRHDPNSASAYNRLGLVHKAMGDDEAAIQDYTNALELDNMDGVIYYNRGRAYLRLGNEDAAIDDFENAVYFEPTFFSAHVYLVSTLLDDNRHDEALEAVEVMIQQFPNEAEAYVWRADIYRDLDDFEAAFDDLFYAIELDDTYPFSYSQLGNIYSRINKPIDALAAYCSYISLVEEPENYIMEWIEEQGGCDS